MDVTIRAYPSLHFYCGLLIVFILTIPSTWADYPASGLWTSAYDPMGVPKHEEWGIVADNTCRHFHPVLPSGYNYFEYRAASPIPDPPTEGATIKIECHLYGDANHLGQPWATTAGFLVYRTTCDANSRYYYPNSRYANPAYVNGTCACNVGYVTYPTAASCVPACPVYASGKPCVCDEGYEFDATRTRCIPVERYTLTLQIDPPAQVEPSQSISVVAKVVNTLTGQPKDGVQVNLKADVEAGTGGHDHDDGQRPKGSIPSGGITQGGGILEFNFGAPAVAGTHTITATCGRCINNPQVATVDVKVEGLVPISDSEFYALQDADGSVIGAVPGKHKANHYLTPEAAAKLAELGETYDGLSNGERLLHLNDASLEWGGLFDVGSRQWKTPHAGHRRGVVIDIRASTTPGSIPFWLFQKFETEAARAGTKAALHCLDSSTLLIGHICYEVLNMRHYHVQLLGVDK